VKQLKNSTTLLLMLSSIILLLVFQFFWIRGAYREAGEDFRKESNMIFRNTVFAMHDSMIEQSIEPVEKEGIYTLRKRRHLHFNDSIFFTENPVRDSVTNHINLREKTARIEIFSSADQKDSLGRILRPLITRMQVDKEPKTFILRLGGDSLRVDSIEYHYRTALKKAGIQANFKVISNQHAHRQTVRPPGEYTAEVRLSPVNQYAVSFAGIEGLLIRKITPQILFSLFLTLLTIGSFYIMNRNLKAQQRLMEIKNDFISNVTHELKTPVATVSVALEALKKFNALDNPQRTAEYLEIAQNELNRLTLMTDKILNTAVYEDQGVDLKIEQVDLDVLIQQILSSMKLVFEKRKTKLSYTKEGTSFIMDGSHAHLTNVLYNMVDNALKYGGDESYLSISLHAADNKITLSVKDKGIGIAPEYTKKIFEKFFRVPSGDIHNTKGYGLGLCYVASVVRSHQGEIAVESEPGQGSIFSITLPIHAQQKS
jgi:two-component system, OmpR family, phosphate regulon sensor histidine kinase PhoR